MITLGIETSCDDTALALIETRIPANIPDDLSTLKISGGFEASEKSLYLNDLSTVATHANGPDESSLNIEYRIISSLVHSQAELHSAYGGVFPNLAKREHGKNLVPLLDKLLSTFPKTSKTPDNIDAEKFREILSNFRADIEFQDPNLWHSLSSADFLKTIPNIDRIAVTEGPGLEPALWVGINFARVLGALWNIPIVAVNHMEGHILGSLLKSDTDTVNWQKLKPIELPAIALLISGGHTELVKIDTHGVVPSVHSSSLQIAEKVHEVDSSIRATSLQKEANVKSVTVEASPFSYTILGQTLDDAVGEAFDKTARLLGLPYPGGPHISKLSEEASRLKTASPVKLPRPMIHSDNLSFSFSGLKTAVLYAVRAAIQPDGTLTDESKRGLAHEFELAVTDTLDSKLRRAIEQIGAKTVIIGGGVSANTMLRERFSNTATEFGLPIYLPSRHISGDNALMIALAGAMDSSISLSPTEIRRKLKADGTKRLSD